MLITSRGADETRASGFRLGRLLHGLDIVCLHGDLGSGKTTFTQGIAKGVGFRGLVVSPTFTLVRVYRAKTWTIYHVDLYRVAAGETGDIGVEECLADPRGICVIEWPEAGEAFYPPDRLELRFSHGRREGERRIAASAAGPRSRALIKKFCEHIGD